jgi:hypothetical protein
VHVDWTSRVILKFLPRCERFLKETAGIADESIHRVAMRHQNINGKAETDKLLNIVESLGQFCKVSQ